MSEIVLRVDNLFVNYGVARAVEGVSFELGSDEIRALIGANGAGKTTILKAILGLVSAAQGSIESPAGRPIQGKKPYEIARECAMGYSPEDRGLLMRMTVQENLEMGIYCRRHRLAGRLPTLLRDIYDLFPQLAARRHQLASILSGGEQRMLSIARALIGQPRVLILDEPTLGLAPVIVEETIRAIQRIGQAGRGLLLAEQNVMVATRTASVIYVMERGRIVYQGSPQDLLGNDQIRTAYLSGTALLPTAEAG